MATSFYSGSGLTNAEQDSIESSLAAAEAAKVAAEAAQAAAETAETNSETAKANSESAKVAAQAAQTSAETAETNALASSASASTSATQSAASATSSASSAASASSAQTASETAQAAAEAALDSFDDTYLGAKTSDPALDNDGNALIDGALYFNTTDNVVKVYDLGSTSWTVVTLSSTDSTNLATVSGQITPTNNLATVAGDSANIGTVASNISGVNSFAERYRVGTTNPTTSLDAGDLFFNTTDDELKVYDGSSWTTGVITGNATQSSDGTMSAADKTKLDGIETAADVTDTTNVVASLTAGDNITIAADGTVAASGGEITVQDEGVDLSTAATTLNFTGNGVVASGTGAAKTINITDTNTTYSDATTSAAGLMSASDKTKLDGIEASADVTDTTNVVASLTAGTNITIAGDGTISATGGSDADTLDGLDSTQFLRSDQADTTTGTLTINDTTNNNKLELSGTTAPYIDFNGGTTGTSLKLRIGHNGSVSPAYNYFHGYGNGYFRFTGTSASPPSLFLTRNDTSVNSGDTLGAIYFGHNDGSTQFPSQAASEHPVRILAEAAETASNLDDGARLKFFTKPVNADKDVDSTERLRIDHDGHVYAYGDMTVSGTLNADMSFDQLTVDGFTLQDSSDRSGLLAITRSTGVGTWRGIQIQPTTTSKWSVMGDQDDFGLYDDENQEWILLYNENSTLDLYSNGTNSFKLGASYMDIPSSIRHMGDTNTYIQFHASDQWRVVTGGTERLEVNNSYTTVRSIRYHNVNFDNSGTNTIRGSVYVSSCTDRAVGKFTTNFSTAKVTANYSCAGAAHMSSSTITCSIGHVSNSSANQYSTTACGHGVEDLDGGMRDTDMNCVQYVGG